MAKRLEALRSEKLKQLAEKVLDPVVESELDLVKSTVKSSEEDRVRAEEEKSSGGKRRGGDVLETLEDAVPALHADVDGIKRRKIAVASGENELDIIEGQMRRQGKK